MKLPDQLRRVFNANHLSRMGSAICDMLDERYPVFGSKDPYAKHLRRALRELSKAAVLGRPKLPVAN